MRAGIALVVALTGGWLAVPCVLVAYLEYTGFGGDRDSGPRAHVLAGYAAMTISCLVVSLLLTRWLAPHVLGRTLLVFAVGVVLGMMTLGIFA